MIITQTPLRLSLLGGNTDFPQYFQRYGGACITTTIDKYLYCIVKERFDDEIWINYSEKEKVKEVNDIKHDLVREAMKLVGVTKGVEITFLSDIPSEGSGLGSSSSLVVGLLNALYQYMGENIPANLLAKQACHIEVDILKKPIGYQDQYAVAYGGFNLIEFDKAVSVKPLEHSLLTDNLLLLYTGVTRKSEDILTDVKLDTKILDQIKDLVYHKLSTITDPVILGDMLDRYWKLKRELNPKTSNRMIDTWYQKALEAGAYGGKIVGAGGGGFLLLVCPPQARQGIKEAVRLEELPFQLSKYGSRVIFNIL